MTISSTIDNANTRYYYIINALTHFFDTHKAHAGILSDWASNAIAYMKPLTVTDINGVTTIAQENWNDSAFIDLLTNTVTNSSTEVDTLIGVKRKFLDDNNYHVAEVSLGTDVAKNYLSNSTNANASTATYTSTKSVKLVLKALSDELASSTDKLKWKNYSSFQIGLLDEMLKDLQDALNKDKSNWKDMDYFIDNLASSDNLRSLLSTLSSGISTLVTDIVALRYQLRLVIQNLSIQVAVNDATLTALASAFSTVVTDLGTVESAIVTLYYGDTKSLITHTY